MNGKRLALICAVGVISLVAAERASAGGGDQRAALLLRKMTAAYASIRSMTAEIQSVSEFAGRKQSVIGSVKIKKPNLVHMETTGEQAMTLISDGKNMTMYIKSMNQYMSMPAKEVGGGIVGATGGNFSLAMVLDPSLKSRFTNAAYAGKEKVDGVNCDVLVLNDSGTEIRLFVQPDYLVRRTTFKMSQGTTQSTTRNVKLNPRITAQTFKFKPPRLAKKMEMGGAAGGDYDAKLLKVGMAAPKFSIPNPGEGTIDLEQTLKGKKAVLINFWFYG